MELPSLEVLDKALCERSLHWFIKSAWKYGEPKEFSSNWHIEAICEHLEAVIKGQIRNLIINIPPRHTKSMTVSVMWPAWAWGPANKAGTRWLFVSYDGGLSMRDSVKCRTVMMSEWYQSLWGDRFKMMGDLNAKERYHNNKGGMRVATSVGGAATGEGGDVLVIDDPHNIKEINSAARRNAVNEWWDVVMTSRMNDPKKGARVIIMQRSHALDLIGHIEERGGVKYEKLVLPTEFEEKRRCATSIGFVDPRITEGELMWPDRFGPVEIEEQKRSLGSHAYAAQHQQRPSLMEGSLFKREWWRFYEEAPYTLADQMEQLFQSWDMTFKDTDGSDYVVGQVWGVRGENRYLIDQVRDRMTFVETKRAVRLLSLRWPKALLKYVEDKANGPAIMSELEKEVGGFKPFNPKGSKDSRAYAVTPIIEAGFVHLPMPLHAPWIDEYLEELAVFNRGAHDDQVDATTQALLVAEQRKPTTRLLAPPASVGQSSSAWAPGRELDHNRLVN